MAGCVVTEGDVVRVWVRNDNGVLKRRFCVIVERIPPGVPKAVLLIFCCSETKHGTHPRRMRRIETDDVAYGLMKLENASTFHIEDTRAFDSRSPQLVPIAKCHRHAFIDLKRLVQRWEAEGNKIKVLPENDKAGPDAKAVMMQRHELAQANLAIKKALPPLPNYAPPVEDDPGDG